VATNQEAVRCALLAERHPGVTEGIHGLLAACFDVVVMVADEISLCESAERLQPALAVVNLSVAPGNRVAWLRQFRARFSSLKLILLSRHDDPGVSHALMTAGADGVVLTTAVVTDLLPAVDAVLAGGQYVSGGVPPDGAGLRAPAEPPLCIPNPGVLQMPHNFSAND